MGILSDFPFNPIPSCSRDKSDRCSTHGRLVRITSSWKGKPANITSASAGFKYFLCNPDSIGTAVTHV